MMADEAADCAGRSTSVPSSRHIPSGPKIALQGVQLSLNTLQMYNENKLQLFHEVASDGDAIIRMRSSHVLTTEVCVKI
jgi:hypothetical protein